MENSNGTNTTINNTTINNGDMTKINPQWIMYVLVWFFLGFLGVHRFVAGKIGSGIGMLALQIIGWLTIILLIGFLFLGIAWIWWLVDGIMILMGKFEEKNGKAVPMNISINSNISKNNTTNKNSNTNQNNNSDKKNETVL